MLSDYARRFSCATLVETGTYLGQGIYHLRHQFSKIYSIELSPELHARARQRFAGYPHITLLLGDSKDVLGEILGRLDGPTLFWLDGHYSGGVTARGETDTPVVEELRLVLSLQDGGHVVLVDDARCFGNDPDYPTIDVVRAMVMSKHPDRIFNVADDIIRIEPPKDPAGPIVPA